MVLPIRIELGRNVSSWRFSCPERVRRNVRSRRRKQTYEPSAGLRFLTRSRPRMCSATAARLQNGWRMLTDHRKFDILRSGAG